MRGAPSPFSSSSFSNLTRSPAPDSYPTSPVPLALPELDGKTEKMYRGGLICLDVHFQPLWTKVVRRVRVPAR